MTVENKRVYELAKEYDMSNKDFIEYLDTKLNIKVKSHSSNLTPAQIDKIKASFNKGSNTESAKKPKAFVIKKVKSPVVEEQPKEVAKEEKISPVKEKEEVKQPEVIAKKSVEQPQTTEKKEEEKPAIPQIRSLLEYNNRNSQKKRQEMMAAENRRRAQETAEKQQRENRPSKFPPRPGQRPEGRSERPDRGDRQDRRPPFDRNNRPDGAPRGERTERQERGDRPMVNKKPLQHHVIPQDIYDGKSGQNQNFKKKGPKDKKKQYKNKEEEQELISLEKAISQKHKKKTKEDGASEVITQVVINQPITVGELAVKIKKSPAEIVKYLMMQGILSTVNETISVETQK